MIKKFLFSTVLTAAIAFSFAAGAQESSKKEEKPVVKSKSVKRHNVKHHDDAYSLKNHKQHVNHSHQNKQPEEVIMFAESKAHTQHVSTPKEHSMTNNDGLSVKVGGKVDIQYGFINQKSEFKYPSNNANLPQIEDNKPQKMPVMPNGSKFTNQDAMVSNAEINIQATKDNFDGQKYGLEMELNANVSPSSSGNTNIGKKVFLFVENNSGRFELGANDGVSEAMALSGATLAKATGGIDGDASSWVPYTVVGNDNSMLQDTFLTSPSLPYASQNSKKANKFTYYSPTFNGFKGGFSYVRDVTVQGTLYEALSFKGSGYRNVLEGGLSYENKFDSINLNLSATGQVGEARNGVNGNKTYNLNRLGAWQVGGKLSMNAFSAAASYGDWGKSGNLKALPAGSPSTKAHFWTAGLAYDHQDKGGVSLTYIQSERRGGFSMNAVDFIDANPNFYKSKNKFESISLGGEYRTMPGFMPYAEVTTFKYKTDLENSKSNKGAVILAGVKLNF